MDILQTIVAHKKTEVADLPSVEAGWPDEIEPRRGFFKALHTPRRGRVALIAEIKKASPSAGLICADFDPVRFATDYEQGGATCLSVLTDRKFFQGQLDYLCDIRAAVRLPLLRKDFIIDERQIPESLDWGADAILLIVSILTDHQLKSFMELARQAHLDALVEVHDEGELDRALDAGAQLIGINNRDLKTFRVDLATSERLAAKVRASGKTTLLVAESGINQSQDVNRLATAGARAILVGESLMRHGNVQEKIRELLD